MMNATDSGRGQTAVAAVFLVGALSVLAVAGVMLTGTAAQDTDRTGEEILTDVNENYNSADSVVTDSVVTVERGEQTRQFEVSAATAGETQMRLNLSDGEQYVLFGTDGDVVWVHDPETTLTGVLEQTDEGVNSTIRAGTDEPTGIGLSALPVELDEIDPETPVSELIAESDEPIPPQYEAMLAELPENTTVADLLSEQGVDADADISEMLARSDTEFGGFEQFNESALSEETALQERFGEFSFDNASMMDNWPASSSNHSELSGDWYSGEKNASADALFERWNESHGTLSMNGTDSAMWDIDKDTMGRHLTALDSDFDLTESSVSVERVGTTTIDGTDAYELHITGSAEDVDYRLWVGQETDTILKQQLTTEEMTVTVDVVDTRFNVAAAASTFEPPGTMTVAEGTVSSVSTASELDARTAFDLATPTAEWEFENGTYATTEAGPLGAVLPEFPDSATSVYTDGTDSLVISQTATERELPSHAVNRTETVTLDDREVQLYTSERGTVARWTTDEMTITVSGELPQDRLEPLVTEISG